MCEATCVRNELETLATEYAEKDTYLANRLHMLIGQLMCVDEGERWCDPYNALARYYAEKAGATITFKGQ